MVMIARMAGVTAKKEARRKAKQQKQAKQKEQLEARRVRAEEQLRVQRMEREEVAAGRMDPEVAAAHSRQRMRAAAEEDAKSQQALDADDDDEQTKVAEERVIRELNTDDLANLKPKEDPSGGRTGWAGRYNRFAFRCRAIEHSGAFQTGIMLVILVASVLVGVNTCASSPPSGWGGGGGRARAHTAAHATHASVEVHTHTPHPPTPPWPLASRRSASMRPLSALVRHARCCHQDRCRHRYWLHW